MHLDLRTLARAWVAQRLTRAIVRAAGRRAQQYGPQLARAGTNAARTGVAAGARAAGTVPAPVPISAIFGGAGVMHFVRPDFFEAIVPDWFPNAKLANVASGAAEVALAVLVLPRATRRPALFGLAALTVIVFPANVDMAVNDVEVKLVDGRFERSVGTADAAGRVVNWARLPLQLPLLWWLLREARRA